MTGEQLYELYRESELRVIGYHSGMHGCFHPWGRTGRGHRAVWDELAQTLEAGHQALINAAKAGKR